MPELPEVERGRRVAARVARQRTIEAVRVHRDPIVFDQVAPRRFRGALRGRRVLEVRRRGKLLWFELDDRPWPVFHFGMTGAFLAPGTVPLPLSSSRGQPDCAWPPRYTKLHLRFDDGGELVMTNARRLGRIRLRNDPVNEPPIANLGFDPLLDLPSSARVAAILQTRSGVIKSVLMNQSVAAGIGNWIADEVLYQAGIDPRRQACTLTGEEVQRLRRKIKSVVQTAVRVDADKDRFPKSWLFHHRWRKTRSPECGAAQRVEHITVGGRTTAWVPARQR